MYHLWDWGKKLAFWLAVIVGTALLCYVLTLVDYHLNQEFIEANIETLPFRYKIALGFAQFEWWAF